MSNTWSHKRPFFLPLVLVVSAVAAVALPAAPAHAEAAPDDDPVAQITQLNRDALTAYQAHKYEDARKLLKQALDVASSAGLDQHPIKARTYIHMGVVMIAGLKQRDAGLKQFAKALEIQPDIQLTKNLVTPDLQAAFDGAVAESKKPKGEQEVADTKEKDQEPPAAPPAAPPPPAAADASSGGLVHEAVTEGKQGSAISISVGVQSDLKFEKLVLAYRSEGAGDFLGRQMKEVSEGTYAAEIPTSATGGTRVQYYIEAEDKEGNPVASRGTADSPLSIALKGSRGGAVVARRSDEDNDDGEDEDEDEEGGGGKKLYLAVLAGIGWGWATGNGDTNADVMIKPAGFAPASTVQFAPEVGYWLRRYLMLSLQGRFQYIAGTTDLVANNRVYHTANYAAAVFAKATWRFGEHMIRPFFSLAAGGGQIRHEVTFKSLKNCGVNMQGSTLMPGTKTCVDTIAAGPVAVGPGGGIMFAFSDSFGLIASVNTQLAFPNFTFNADLDLGAAVQF